MDRRARHDAVSTALARLTDGQLRDRVASGVPVSAGIGGDACLLNVGGHDVFVKRVLLTDIERQPHNVLSTENMFGLPPWFHYGVGSVGFSAWRELAVHLLVTDWVLAGTSEAFPLLHHWRVLEGRGERASTLAEEDGLDASVGFWHDSPAVRARLQALADASAELVLFLEYVPKNLLGWLTDKRAQGLAVVDQACARVERQLISAARFMSANGLWHFDAHLRNVLADDTRLYVSDFGLAASSSFDLDETERRFLDEHVEHDMAFVMKELVNWIVSALTESAPGWTHPRDRNEYIRRCADGYQPPELPPATSAIVRRHAPVAVVMNDFYFALHGASRLTPYPASAVEHACVASGIDVGRSL